MQTPMVDDVRDENPVPVNPKQASEYRSCVARSLFLSQDRADMTFAVHELCQKMSDPSVNSFNELKRLIRYLKGQWSQVLVGNMSSEATVFSDADWLETRKQESHQAQESRYWVDTI